MKTKLILLFPVILLIVSCNSSKSPVVGAWKMVSMQFFDSGKLVGTYPNDTIKGSQTKVWTDNYQEFVGESITPKDTMNNYGGGKYIFVGNHYTEYLDYFPVKSVVGTSTKMLLEMKNDTIIQSYPTDENFKLGKSYRVEKYIRVK
jgi:hypothetical protein